MFTFNPNLFWMIAGTFGALVAGSLIRGFSLIHSDPERIKERLGSLKVWWVLAALWSIAALFGKPGATLLLMVASTLGMREYLILLGPEKVLGRPAIVCLAICGLAHYLIILFGGHWLAVLFFPISSLLSLAVVRSFTCSTQDYVRITAGLYWGGMLLIYGVSHSIFLFDLEFESIPWAGIAGWFLFLILLTELNDIMQAVVGRKFGRHRMIPGVSPRKSLEGLAGGIISTVICSLVLAPFLTTFFLDWDRAWAIVLCSTSGLLISVSGFLGDINMSAIKRDAGVKDGSQLFPGMGGVIDRVDSMTFTGPVFYYFLVCLSFLNPSIGASG